MRGLSLAAILAVAACGPAVDVGGDASGATTTATESSTSTSADPSTASLSTSNSTTASETDPETTVPATSVDPADTSTTDHTCSFIVCPDTGVEIPCDIWGRDCPRGYKCMPWASDGGDRWDDARCFPLDPTPVELGDVCSAYGGGMSGVDDCDADSICMYVDPRTGLGTCSPFCTGTARDPYCDSPSTACALEFDGAFAACLANCDPRRQACEVGGCYATANDGFVCAPTLGVGLGVGETCTHAWECAPGLACFDGAVVPDCPGDRCCTAYCDLWGPNTCGELVCGPFFAPDQSPGAPGPVGVCISP